MQQAKWFDRKFNFDFEENIFPSIIDRLAGTVTRLDNKLTMMRAPVTITGICLDDEWSIRENIGHLIDMEPLWLGRLDDIIEGKPEMRLADLQNRQTYEANYNRKTLNELTYTFRRLRLKTLERLRQLDEETVYKSSIHPRLKKPMRVMDLFLFVAEHDDHHLVKITELISELSPK